MNTEDFKKAIQAAVSEYVSATEAWDDAMLTVDTVSGAVGLAEEEETEDLPDSVDVYDIMDFIEMDPDGTWKTDEDSIDSVVGEYA